MPFSYQHSSSSSSSLLFLPYSFRRRALALCSQPPLTHYMSLKPSSRAAHIRCYHGGLCCTSIGDTIYVPATTTTTTTTIFPISLDGLARESPDYVCALLPHLVLYVFQNCRFIGISLCVSSFLKRAESFLFFDKKIKSPFFKNSLGILKNCFFFVMN